MLVGPFTDPAAAWQRLLEQGILVRDVGLPRWLRVTIGTTEQMTTLAAAMAGLEDLRETRMSRTARVERTTKESEVLVELDLDGTGRSEISTGVPVLRPHAGPSGPPRRSGPDRPHPR